MVKAVVFTSDPTNIDAVDRCLQEAQRRGCELLGIAQDWSAIQELLDKGIADVVVVDRRSEIPLDPRIAVVAESRGPRQLRCARTSRIIRHRG